ncbi:Maf-like protein [Agaricicola taiwanensis]|uniref:Nucleoside triphosphate pyrophosphatase n=1 Tax=Agaricicola taiwanensis TaxID=591372 RepID=A0A8J2VK61_9RHOB|nr:Maf family protein [Agaricicola taiwanensis]GGE28836.1 Maf-like protein [Agaricicola taiwanensis]
MTEHHPFWRLVDPLVLASSSPARARMLVSVGLPIETDPADVDERTLESELVTRGAHAPTVALGLARAKARTVSLRRPGRLVLGADQVLALGDERFAKAPDQSIAFNNLKRLSGKEHALHSAFALVKDGDFVADGVETATLVMREMSDAFLERYMDVAGAVATATVGGYQLESIGAQLFDRVEGDYFTVLGLPLLRVLSELRRIGVLAA